MGMLLAALAVALVGGGAAFYFKVAFLVSPPGLPVLNGWLAERLHGVKYTLMDFVAS